MYEYISYLTLSEVFKDFSLVVSLCPFYLKEGLFGHNLIWDWDNPYDDKILNAIVILASSELHLTDIVTVFRPPKSIFIFYKLYNNLAVTYTV